MVNLLHAIEILALAAVYPIVFSFVRRGDDLRKEQFRRAQQIRDLQALSSQVRPPLALPVFSLFETPEALFSSISQNLRDFCPDKLSDCQRCQHFHGRTYNDNLLVCGMHPYGQVDCPDFEQKTSIFPS